MKKLLYIPGVHESKEGLVKNLRKRFNLEVLQEWNSIKELEELSMEDLHKKILAKKPKLLSGRSFGAGIALTLKSGSVKAKILFAPAIMFADKNKFQKKKKFKYIHRFYENTITKEYIESQKIPILIIHGKNDKAIPYSNSKKMAEECKNVTLITTKHDHDFIESKDLIEDIDFVRRTEKAWKKYEKGDFKSKNSKDFLKELD